MKEIIKNYRAKKLPQKLSSVLLLSIMAVDELLENDDYVILSSCENAYFHRPNYINSGKTLLSYSGALCALRYDLPPDNKYDMEKLKDFFIGEHEYNILTAIDFISIGAISLGYKTMFPEIGTKTFDILTTFDREEENVIVSKETNMELLQNEFVKLKLEGL